MFCFRNEQMEFHKAIEAACNAIGDGNLGVAKEVIRTKYPFCPPDKAGRQYSYYQKMKMFIRDGFIDRYSGEKMVFPPVLRLLSKLMPEDLPFQKNWKMSECHLAYWQLLPTVDHIVPVSRGGVDDESNWVCTSQLRNSAKSNWLLEELGWQLHEPGNFSKWDGLVNWFIAYTIDNPQILEDGYIRSWHSVASKVIETWPGEHHTEIHKLRR